MNIMVIFLLAALATGGADECPEVEACNKDLKASVLGDATDEESCAEAYIAVDCLHEIKGKCDEGDEEVEKSLKSLKRLIRDNCQDKEIECLQATEDLTEHCIAEGATQALSIYFADEDMDENLLVCIMYFATTHCIVEKSGEICGDKAAEIMEEELKFLPDKVSKACGASGGITLDHFRVDEEKK